MKDKQIIIDGIDVSGCENFRPDADTSEISYTNACSIGLWQRWYSNLEPSCTMSCSCKENPNCNYKQLKRLEKLLSDINGKFYKAVDDLKAKEQECERLNADSISLRDRVVKLERAILRRNEQLGRLKSENEELKDLNTRLDNQRETYWKEYQKLEKELNDYKERWLRSYGC